MDEFTPQQFQPVPKPPRPTSVTVFGVLNCVFGGLAIICTPVSIGAIALFSEHAGMSHEYRIWTIASGIIGVPFAVFLIIAGVGLLMMRNWGRTCSIIYVSITIVWVFVGVAVSFYGLSRGWMPVSQQEMPAFIGGTCGGLCGGLLYPIILLIFMLTPKVRTAFRAAGQ